MTCCVWAGCAVPSREATLCVHLVRPCGHAPGRGTYRPNLPMRLIRWDNGRAPSCDACAARVRAQECERATRCPWCEVVNKPGVVRIHDWVEASLC